MLDFLGSPFIKLRIRVKPVFNLTVMLGLAACAARAPQEKPELAGTGSKAKLVEPTVLSEDSTRRDAKYKPLATNIINAYSNYLGIFSPLIANFSPDGKSFLFGSNRDGRPEVYIGEIDRPSAAPKAITEGSGRTNYAVFSRDGSTILFLRDQEGNEKFSIWSVKRDGTQLVNVTPNSDWSHSPPHLPKRQPGVMIYSTSRNSDTRTEIFEQNFAGGKPRLIYRHHQTLGSLADVTEDGKRLLFNEYHSIRNIVTHEIDSVTGKPRRIFPPEGIEAGTTSSVYSADGKRILIATDLGGSAAVITLDAATGQELNRYVHKDLPTASLSIKPSPNGKSIAVRIDAGDHGELMLLDATTLKSQRRIQAPLGDIRLGSFSDDSRVFSIVISRPEQPADVFLVETASGSVKPLRVESRPSLGELPPVEARIESAQAFDGLRIPINVYLPKLDKSRRLPTIVNFHGGPFTSYAVRWDATMRFFVSLGYAVIEPNVRGSSGFGAAYEMADNREKRADWLKDVATVNAWAKSQPWCDPERVIVWGQSYGGYTTLMALTRQPDLWRAGVDLYGPSDLRTLLRGTNAAIRSLLATEFGDLDKDTALLEQFSPIRDFDKIRAPLFVYAGANDTRVLRSESDAIVDALRTRNVPVEYMVAPNEGHSAALSETRIELLTRTARFLEDALK